MKEIKLANLGLKPKLALSEVIQNNKIRFEISNNSYLHEFFELPTHIDYISLSYDMIELIIVEYALEYDQYLLIIIDEDNETIEFYATSDYLDVLPYISNTKISCKLYGKNNIKNN